MSGDLRTARDKAIADSQAAYADALARAHELLNGDGVVAVMGGVPFEELVTFELQGSYPSRRWCVGRLRGANEPVEFLGPERELAFGFEERDGRTWWTISVG